MRRLTVLALVLLPLPAAAQGPNDGRPLAERWCMACHVIERAPQGGDFDEIATVAATTYRDTTDLAPQTTYRYRVRARDNAGNASAQGTEISATDGAGPSDPRARASAICSRPSTLAPGTARNKSPGRTLRLSRVSSRISGSLLPLKANSLLNGIVINRAADFTLGELLEQCRAANLLNGRVIRTSQTAANSVLSILRGTETPNLYDSRGSTARIAQQRPLSQA